MTLDKAFLADILAHPDDDAPRLIYADCLEENGDPERAEFIRLQCKLEKMTEGDPCCPELEGREQELLTANEQAWAKPLRSMVKSWQFRRGFIEWVQMTAARFLRHGGFLLRFAPVRSVSFLGEVGARLSKLASSPYLARLSELDMVKVGLSGEGTQVLASSAYLANLTSLYLSGNDIGDLGAAALASSPHLANLTRLNLNGNRIGAEGAAALASSPYLAKLTSPSIKDAS
jgi:uncharacterized protein (TIGR02996 family)